MRKLNLFTFTKAFEFSVNNGIGQVTGFIPYYDKSDPGTEYAVTERMRIRFAPKAFEKRLARMDAEPIFAYYNHDSSAVIASTQNGTLKFTDFAGWLRYAATLDLNDPDANRAYSKISSGLVKGTSFGGTVANEEWYSEDEYDVNLITEFDMFEVSPTARPAFTGSKVIVKADADEIQKSWEAWQTQVWLKKIAAYSTK